MLVIISNDFKINFDFEMFRLRIIAIEVIIIVYFVTIIKPDGNCNEGKNFIINIDYYYFSTM